MTTTTPGAASPRRESALARVALRFTNFTEKYVPDAFGFVLVGTILVAFLGLVTGEPIFGRAADPAKPAGMGLVDAWGAGFWSLITFTLQMAMVILGGYAVAASAPMSRVITWLARIPRSPRAAVAFVAAMSMASSYFNWAFSLVFSAILAREVARVVKDTDYRAVGAMAFLGLGTVWAQGFSGSAALQVASATSNPPQVQAEIRKFGLESGVIPLDGTILTWRAVLATLIIFTVGVVTAWFLAPRGDGVRTADDLGIALRPLVGPGSLAQEECAAEGPARPGDWIERSPLFTVVIVAISATWIVRTFAAAKNPVLALDLNMVNLILLTLAAALHWRPMRLARAVADGVGAVSGVLLQFPFYGGIFGMITYTGLSHRIAGWLVSASSEFLYPAVIAVYSMILGVFVPSGGSKWVIEAPYVLDAAHQLGVDPGWMVVVYDLGEASANLLQPFWMLPTLAVLGLKARDVMGYTFAMFLTCFPAALVTVTLLAPHTR